VRQVRADAAKVPEVATGLNCPLRPLRDGVMATGRGERRHSQ
jgi:hypothetical protein